jgi:hypothetical protein
MQYLKLAAKTNRRGQPLELVAFSSQFSQVGQASYV